jgi:hypothetical protein
VIPLIDKRIIATSVGDARFPPDEPIEGLFDLPLEVGKRIRLDFDDHTSIIFTAINDPHNADEPLVIMRKGAWRDVDGRIEPLY